MIPASLRRKFGIKCGTRIEIEADEETQSIDLKPITRSFVYSLLGKHNGKGLLRALMAERKAERKLHELS